MCKNNEKNDKFYRKVASLMYTEIVNFMPQSWKAASKLEPHRGLDTTILPKNYGQNCEKRRCPRHHKQCTTNLKDHTAGSVSELYYIYRKT